MTKTSRHSRSPARSTGRRRSASAAGYEAGEGDHGDRSGTANSERVRPTFDGVEYGQSNNQMWRSVTSQNVPVPRYPRWTPAEPRPDDACGE